MMTTFSFPLSKRRLLARHAFAVALTVGPAAGLMVYEAARERNRIIRFALSSMENELRTVLRRYDDGIGGARAVLDGLTRDDPFPALPSEDECRARFDRVPDLTRPLLTMRVIAKGGRMICSSAGAQLRDDRDAAAIAGAGVSEGRTTITEPPSAKTDKGLSVLVSRSLRDRKTGQIASVFVGTIALTSPDLMGMVGGSGGSLMLFSIDGTIVPEHIGTFGLSLSALRARFLRSPDATGGAALIGDTDGQDWLAVWVPLHDSSLRLVFSRPASMLGVGHDIGIVGNLILIAIVGLIGFAGIAALDHWLIVNPLRQAWARLAFSAYRFRRLTEDSCDLMITMRPGEPHIDVSPKIGALLGYAVSETSRLSVRALIHEEDLTRVAAMRAALTVDAPRAVAAFRLIRKDGHVLWVEATFYRMARADQGVDFIMTIRDVTQRHREAEALRVASEQARRAQADADEANQAKTEFLAGMSHEIRTPLNAIIGFTAVLLDVPDLNQQARHYTQRIKGAGNALLTIVDDILDFSQVEAGIIELKPRAFALPLLVDECFSIVQQAAVSKHLSLDVNLADPLPSGVLGDEARLRQILLNLLNNAIKFTHKGSVLLDIRYDDTGHSRRRLKFSVSDTGIGIRLADQSRLFQRFRQVDGTNRRTYGGTGLGLAISKRLVDLMGGTIGVSSEKGRGSTFWFVLDLPAAPLLLQATRTLSTPAGRPMSLLLVEDVAINQELIGLMLKAAGHAVDVVGDGADAIMAARDKRYDAILMDIQMPHVDGMTAARAIRRLPEPYHRVPIIAMTANVLPEQARLARAAGMDDIIHKPFTAAALHDVLKRSEPEPHVGDDSMIPIAFDNDVRARLVVLIGEKKVNALLATLVLSLSDRLTADRETRDGRARLRADAHACVAGAGMLGFRRFAALCQAFERAPDDESFTVALDRLQAASAETQAKARSLIEQSASDQPESPGGVVSEAVSF